jgi:hypothetical protein
LAFGPAACFLAVLAADKTRTRVSSFQRVCDYHNPDPVVSRELLADFAIAGDFKVKVLYE